MKMLKVFGKIDVFFTHKTASVIEFSAWTVERWTANLKVACSSPVLIMHRCSSRILCLGRKTT